MQILAGQRSWSLKVQVPKYELLRASRVRIVMMVLACLDTSYLSTWTRRVEALRRGPPWWFPEISTRVAGLVRSAAGWPVGFLLRVCTRCLYDVCIYRATSMHLCQTQGVYSVYSVDLQPPIREKIRIPWSTPKQSCCDSFQCLEHTAKTSMAA